MTFNDIFKSNFLDNMTSFSIIDTILAIVISLLIGVFIFAIYKKTYTGVLYSRNFNITLLAMTMVTTLIIIGVTSNVVLSLGMVGALSIVRFRTAIKDPMDTFFIFWSIAVGILCGAGQLPLATLGSLIIGLVLLVVVNHITIENPYLFIVKLNGNSKEEDILDILSNSGISFETKTKIINDLNKEITYEVNLKNHNSDFVNIISNLEGIKSATLLAYDGNFAA